MTILQPLLFGIVEGLTEFIPVSSTAHLLLLQHTLGIGSSEAMFAYLVLVQMGAIGALLIYFWRELWALARAFLARPYSTPGNRLAWLILVATIPALVAGAILHEAAQALFAEPLLEATIRLFTAAALLGLGEFLGKKSRDISEMTLVDSTTIGLFQVLAVFPGASRSGASIAGGLLRNLDRPAATRFAFLMSAPIMLAAGVYEAIGVWGSGLSGSLLAGLPLGLLVSGIVGWFSIRWLIQFVAGHSLYIFAIYCTAMGVVCLLLRAG